MVEWVRVKTMNLNRRINEEKDIKNLSNFFKALIRVILPLDSLNFVNLSVLTAIAENDYLESKQTGRTE